MIFNGINDQSVELRIINYQFPEITNCEYDSNWLLMSLKVESHGGNWETVDPFLLVRELKTMIEWFEKLSNHVETDSNSLIFIEPNLEFKLIKKTKAEKHIKIIFNLEPQYEKAHGHRENFIYAVYNHKDLNLIVKQLKEEAEHYPQRAIS